MEEGRTFSRAPVKDGASRCSGVALARLWKEVGDQGDGLRVEERSRTERQRRKNMCRTDDSAPCVGGEVYWVQQQTNG